MTIKKPTGRPRGGERRDQRLFIKVSATEHAWIKAQAAAEGVSMSRWIRSRVLPQDVTPGQRLADDHRQARERLDDLRGKVLAAERDFQIAEDKLHQALAYGGSDHRDPGELG